MCNINNQINFGRLTCFCKMKSISSLTVLNAKMLSRQLLACLRGVKLYQPLNYSMVGNIQQIWFRCAQNIKPHHTSLDSIPWCHFCQSLGIVISSFCLSVFIVVNIITQKSFLLHHEIQRKGHTSNGLKNIENKRHCLRLPGKRQKLTLFEITINIIYRLES